MLQVGMEMYRYCYYNGIFLLSMFQCFDKRIPRALPDCPSPLSSSSFSHPLLVCSLSVCCNHITLFHSLLVCLTLSFVELSGSGAAVKRGETESQPLLQPLRTSLRQSCRRSFFYSSCRFSSCLF